MKKLLVVASSLDLRAPLSSTPSWWQLLKSLAEVRKLIDKSVLDAFAPTD